MKQLIVQPIEGGRYDKNNNRPNLGYKYYRSEKAQG